MTHAQLPPTLEHGAIPSLDGIRALSVSLVFVAHSGLGDFIPGGLGVSIFFVLSGYLISTLMRIEFARTGAIDYRGFYLRRLVRLMPPLLIVVVATGLLSRLSLIGGEFTLGGLLSALFYFGNYYVIAHDYHGLPDGLGVIWSLAVEEHYYLFYPPLAALLLRLGRVGLSASVLALLCVAVLAWRYWLMLHGAAPDYVGVATDTRIDAILIGCLMALWRNPWLDRGVDREARYDWVVAAGCIAVLAGTLLYRDELFRHTLRYTLQNLAIAPLIYLAVAHAQRAPFRWLNSKPLVYLGSISYTVYLTHHVILLMIAKHWPQLNWTALLLATALMTLAVAEPMRRWVELPSARLRKRLHRSRAISPATAPLHAAGSP